MEDQDCDYNSATGMAIPGEAGSTKTIFHKKWFEVMGRGRHWRKKWDINWWHESIIFVVTRSICYCMILQSRTQSGLSFVNTQKVKILCDLKCTERAFTCLVSISSLWVEWAVAMKPTFHPFVCVIEFWQGSHWIGLRNVAARPLIMCALSDKRQRLPDPVTY